MPTGRNDPCPCGSGRKYKRCCHDREAAAASVAPTLALALTEVGRLAWRDHPESCLEALGEVYDDVPGTFGMLGPTPWEMLVAEMWFLLDRPLAEGRTALELVGAQAAERRAREWLEHSSIGLWRVEEAPGTVGLRSELTGRYAVVSTAGPTLRRPAGSLVVTRVAEMVPGTAVLAGAVIHVDPEAEDEVLSLARRAWREAGAGDSPAWRTSGGRDLVRAALCWPDRRLCTRDGERVRSATAAYSLADLGAAADRLARAPELMEIEPGPGEVEGLHAWEWRVPAGTLPSADPPAEPGVRWERCEEDADPASVSLARIDVDPFDDSLWLFAPTPERLAQAEGLCHRALGALISERTVHEVEDPDALPRWKQQRLDDLAREWDEREARLRRSRPAVARRPRPALAA